MNKICSYTLWFIILIFNNFNDLKIYNKLLYSSFIILVVIRIADKIKTLYSLCIKKKCEKQSTHYIMIHNIFLIFIVLK